VAVKIRLKRMGKIRTPYYRIVVADSRTKRDGRVIEEIGTYNPKTEPSTISVKSERAQYWLGVGAQPTEAVAAILKLTGDIGGKPSLKDPEPKADKAALFDAALKELHAEPKVKKMPAKKAEKKAEEPKAVEAPAEEPKAEETPAEETPVEEPKVEETPAEEPKADEAPAEEAKAEETPAEEPKADDADEKPEA
jgi:small subunit ribosomal protein S16